MKVFHVEPMGKPRMTQRDKWKKRPVVERYWEFKDALSLQATWFDFPDVLNLQFYLTMPESWSKKKRDEHRGKPHQQKPDLSNMIKAFEDCLYENDSRIYKVTAEKFWADEGMIVLL